MFQLLLTVLQLFGTLLLSLKFPDVIHRGLQNSALVPAHVPEQHTQAADTSTPDRLSINSTNSMYSSASCVSVYILNTAALTGH